MAGNARRGVLVTAGATMLLLGVATFSYWFLILGASLIAASQMSASPHAQAALIVGSVTLVTTVLLVAPFQCTTTRTSGVNEADLDPLDRTGTVCSNALGIDYSGGLSYDPPMWPAAAVGFGGGILFAGAAVGLVEASRRRRHRRGRSASDA